MLSLKHLWNIHRLNRKFYFDSYRYMTSFVEPECVRSNRWCPCRQCRQKFHVKPSKTTTNDLNLWGVRSDDQHSLTQYPSSQSGRCQCQGCRRANSRSDLSFGGGGM